MKELLRIYSSLILLPCVLSISVLSFSSSNSLTLVNGRNIVSSNEVFELGLFPFPPPPENETITLYIGIWYKNVSPETYVWVANRDHPFSTSTATFKISNRNLHLLNQVDTPIRSWNLSGRRYVRSQVVAELQYSGNFVVKEAKPRNPNYRIMWQSFDYPTDTLLPGMKLGLDLKTKNNRSLTSWRSPRDLSSGEYSFNLRTRGFPQFYLATEFDTGFRSGLWDGIQFNGLPEMTRRDNLALNYSFTDNREEITFSFSDMYPFEHSRLVLHSTPELELSTWSQGTEKWSTVWNIFPKQCDWYQVCGANSYCADNKSPNCSCIVGYVPKYLGLWDFGIWKDGCVRRTPPSCEDDGFILLKNMKLPEATEVIVDPIMGLEECKRKCQRHCNCTALANSDFRNNGSGCVIWTTKLEDMRTFGGVDGQDLYVRVAAADLGEEINTNKKTNSYFKLSFIIGGSGVMLLLSFTIVWWFWRKKKQNRAKNRAAPALHQERIEVSLMDGMVISSGQHLSYLSEENMTEDLELPLIEFEAIVMATDNFSDCNKLGQGGFGSVYKGKLANGQDIAVKRLSEMSDQGTNEFKNEVKLIMRLQHVNLVRILGCCSKYNEKMVVYEYLENSSLDGYLFDKTRSSKLNWQKRFDIANGIARGILYLHQDSRCMIIHRDLKASNVLLDKDMTPKISDFGMARIFARDDGEAITKRIVGTYGYMSPEYAMDGRFSVKSDVFSFGVLVLEIVSGKRNKGFYNANQDDNLLSYLVFDNEGALELVFMIFGDLDN